MKITQKEDKREVISVWIGKNIKFNYFLKRDNFGEIPIRFKLSRETGTRNYDIATFEGYKVREPDYYRFVNLNLMALFELPTYDRIAIEEALSILNSDML